MSRQGNVSWADAQGSFLQVSTNTPAGGDVQVPWGWGGIHE